MHIFFPSSTQSACGTPFLPCGRTLCMTHGAHDVERVSLQSASAGNRTRVTSMATMYSTTRPLMLLVCLKGTTTGVSTPISLSYMKTIEPQAPRVRIDASTSSAHCCRRGQQAAESGALCAAKCRRPWGPDVSFVLPWKLGYRGLQGHVV